MSDYSLTFRDYEAIHFQLSRSIEHIMVNRDQQNHNIQVGTLRPGTNGRQFADGISNHIFLNDDMQAFVHIMD